MTILHVHLAIVAALSSVAPCAYPQAVEPPASVAYRLVAGDVLDIRFFLNPELNDQVQIRPDGRVSLQLVGEAELAGMTVTEATKKIEQLYSTELRSPRASIQVRVFATQKVFVTGEVNRPGPFSMPGRMTVLDAISEAGGIKRTADEGLAVLIRKGPDGYPVGRRLRPLRKGAPTSDAGILLLPFDVVMIPESKIARLDRWVDQHIRQLIPVSASAGFAYIMQRQGGGTVPIPIF
jgi:protein involved in polysaccharide export with SLBB domain